MGADSRLRIAGVIGEPHPFSKWVVWLLGVLVSVHDLTNPANVWRRYAAQAAREPACYHWHGLWKADQLQRGCNLFAATHRPMTVTPGARLAPNRPPMRFYLHRAIVTGLPALVLAACSLAPASVATTAATAPAVPRASACSAMHAPTPARWS